MSQKSNPVAIGVFVLAAFFLAIGGLIYIGSAKAFSRSSKFILYFDDSINGLSVGSPVKFKGVTIGEVDKIFIRRNQAESSDAIPVVISVDVDNLLAMGVEDAFDDLEEFRKQVNQQGLRGKLEFISYVTGLLYIELDFHKDLPVPEAVQLPNKDGYLEIPTLSSSLADLQKGITKTLAEISQIDFGLMSKKLILLLDQLEDSLSDMDLKGISENVNETLAGLQQRVADPRIDESLARLSQTMAHAESLTAQWAEMSPEILQKVSDSLGSLQQSLTQIEGLTSERSDLQLGVAQTLREVADAAESIRRLADYLERNPQSLIRGK